MHYNQFNSNTTGCGLVTWFRSCIWAYFSYAGLNCDLRDLIKLWEMLSLLKREKELKSLHLATLIISNFQLILLPALWKFTLVNNCSLKSPGLKGWQHKEEQVLSKQLKPEDCTEATEEQQLLLIPPMPVPKRLSSRHMIYFLKSNNYSKCMGNSETEY